MNVKRWIAALGGVLLVDIVIGLALLRIALEENCDNGIPRWQCSESLQDLLVAALIAVPALYVTVFVMVVMRAWLERRETSAPN